MYPVLQVHPDSKEVWLFDGKELLPSPKYLGVVDVEAIIDELLVKPWKRSIPDDVEFAWTAVLLPFTKGLWLVIGRGGGVNVIDIVLKLFVPFVFP